MFNKFTTILCLPLLASAAPLMSRQQLVPDLPPQVDLVYAETMVRSAANKATGANGRYNYYGDWLNKVVPVANIVASVIGAEQVTAIDVLADRLCIAGYDQGSTCDELFAYAYTWIKMQESGKTYGEMAEILGANNMKQLHDDLHVVCIGQEVPDQFVKGLCQVLLEDTDILANSIIGESDRAEDADNSNSLEYFGLSKILPAPRPIIP